MGHEYEICFFKLKALIDEAFVNRPINTPSKNTVKHLCIAELLNLSDSGNNISANKTKFDRYANDKKTVLVSLGKVEATLGHIYGRVHCLTMRDVLLVLEPDRKVQTDILEGVSKTENGEIEWRGRTRHVLTEDKTEFRFVHEYARIVVDDVWFLDKADGTRKEGEYLRIISPKGEGAVALPVDLDSGQVLLISQYRWPVQSWQVEAPRGFAMLIDDGDPEKTAIRELEEEGGLSPLVRDKGRPEVYYLGELFPDTGKLSDRPRSYLISVRREQEEKLLSMLQNTLTKFPIWVPLDLFFRAIFNHEGIPFEENDIKHIQTDETIKRFHNNPDLSRSLLKVSDMFTMAAALRAYPIIIQKLRSLNTNESMLNKILYMEKLLVSHRGA